MKTYKFKLYKTKKQKHLHKQVDVAGLVYNHFIAIHKCYYRLFGKYPSKFNLQRHLTKLKRQQRFTHWSLVGSQALQNIIIRIDFGYQKLFKQENKRAPTFRKLCNFKSFTLTQSGWRLNDDGSIIIGKHKYKYFNSQEVQGTPKLMHVKRDTLGDFYIFIITDHEEPQPSIPQSSNSAGFDFGLKTFLTSSEDEKITSPQFFKQGSNELAKAQRVLSRKKRGSKSRKQAVKQVARVHKQITARRADWHWKTAKSLAKEHGLICIEDLNIKGMKAMWGRKVSDIGFYSFVLKLQHQCDKYGSILHKIDRWFPSTKTCSGCGQQHDMPIVKRTMLCGCGIDMDRDLNAAINIKREGMSSLGLGTVSRTLCSARTA